MLNFVFIFVVLMPALGASTSLNETEETLTFLFTEFTLFVLENETKDFVCSKRSSELTKNVNELKAAFRRVSTCRTNFFLETISDSFLQKTESCDLSAKTISLFMKTKTALRVLLASSTAEKQNETVFSAHKHVELALLFYEAMQHLLSLGRAILLQTRLLLRNFNLAGSVHRNRRRFVLSNGEKVTELVRRIFATLPTTALSSVVQQGLVATFCNSKAEVVSNKVVVFLLFFYKQRKKENSHKVALLDKLQTLLLKEKELVLARAEGLAAQPNAKEAAEFANSLFAEAFFYHSFWEVRFLVEKLHTLLSNTPNPSSANVKLVLEEFFSDHKHFLSSFFLEKVDTALALLGVAGKVSRVTKRVVKTFLKILKCVFPTFLLELLISILCSDKAADLFKRLARRIGRRIDYW